MIEAGRFPGRGRVANGAISRKRREHMPGTHDGIVICLMAGDALDRRPLIAVVLVALRAENGSVRAGQRELSFGMVKR